MARGEAIHRGFSSNPVLECALVRDIDRVYKMLIGGSTRNRRSFEKRDATKTCRLQRTIPRLVDKTIITWLRERTTCATTCDTPTSVHLFVAWHRWIIIISDRYVLRHGYRTHATTALTKSSPRHTTRLAILCLFIPALGRCMTLRLVSDSFEDRVQTVKDIYRSTKISFHEYL